MVRSLSVLSKIYLASGKTQLGTELADKAAKRLKRLGAVPRTRNTRARLDRDTPDFSVDPGAPPGAQQMKPPATRPPLSDAPTASTPNRSGSPSAPSTPATLGLMRSVYEPVDGYSGVAAKAFSFLKGTDHPNARAVTDSARPGHLRTSSHGQLADPSPADDRSGPFSDPNQYAQSPYPQEKQQRNPFI